MPLYLFQIWNPHEPGSLTDWVSPFHLVYTGLPYWLDLRNGLQVARFLFLRKGSLPSKEHGGGQPLGICLQKSFLLLLETNLEFIPPLMVSPTPWVVGLGSSALLLIPGRKVFIRTKEEPVLPEASMGRHHVGLPSVLKTVTSGWHGQKWQEPARTRLWQPGS